MKRQVSILILLMLVIAIPTFAQLKVTLNMSARPDPYISNWAERKETVIVTITNSSSNSVRAKFDCKINKDGSLIVNTKPEKMKIIDIPEGVSQYYGEDLVPLEAAKIKEGVENTTIKTGMLPAGSYEFCCSLLDLQNKQLTAPVCKNFTLQSFQAPVLLQPEDKSILAQNKRPMFRWTPLSPKPTFPVTYRIQVFEILSGQTPINAFRVNQPILDVNGVVGTQFMWPADVEMPNPKLQHIWTVRAEDEKGSAIGENGGYATPFTFRACCDENTPNPTDDIADIGNISKSGSGSGSGNGSGTGDGSGTGSGAIIGNAISDSTVGGAQSKSSAATPPCVNFKPYIAIRPPSNSSSDIPDGGTYNYSPLINYGSLSQNALKLFIQNNATNTDNGMIVMPCLKVYIKKGTGNWVQYLITLSFNNGGNMILQIPHNQFDIGTNQIKVETYNCPNTNQSQVKCFPDQIITVIKEQGKWDQPADIPTNCPCMLNPTAELIWWPNGVEKQPASYLAPTQTLNIPYHPTANIDKFIEIRVNPHPGKTIHGDCQPRIEVLQNGSPYINMLAKDYMNRPWPSSQTAQECCPPGPLCNQYPCPTNEIALGNCYKEVTVPPFLHNKGPNPSKWFLNYQNLFYEGTHTFTVNVWCCNAEQDCNIYKVLPCQTYNFTVNRLPKPKVSGNVNLIRECVCDSTRDLHFTDVPIVTIAGYKYKMSGTMSNCSLKIYERKGTFPNYYFDSFIVPFVNNGFTPVIKPPVYFEIVDEWGDAVPDGTVKINNVLKNHKDTISTYFGWINPAHHLVDYSNWHWNADNCLCLPLDQRYPGPKKHTAQLAFPFKPFKLGFKEKNNTKEEEFKLSIFQNEGLVFEKSVSGKTIQINNNDIAASIQKEEGLSEKIEIIEVTPNTDTTKPQLTVLYSLPNGKKGQFGFDVFGFSDDPEISAAVNPIPGVGIIIKKGPTGVLHFIIPGDVVNEGSDESSNESTDVQEQGGDNAKKSMNTSSTCSCISGQSPPECYIGWPVKPGPGQIQGFKQYQENETIILPYYQTSNFLDKWFDIRVNPHPNQTNNDGQWASFVEVSLNGSTQINWLSNTMSMPTGCSVAPCYQECGCFRWGPKVVNPALYKGTGRFLIFQSIPVGTNLLTVKIRCGSCSGEICKQFNYTIIREPEPPPPTADISLLRVCCCDTITKPTPGNPHTAIISVSGYKYKMTGTVTNAKLKIESGPSNNTIIIPFVQGSFTPICKPPVKITVLNASSETIAPNGSVKINGLQSPYNSVENCHLKDVNKPMWNVNNCDCLPPTGQKKGKVNPAIKKNP